ncbi:MAG TPA: MFS transporter [Candidatus Binatia bacterium]|jgi:MFS family permease
MKNRVMPWNVLAARDFGLFWSSLLISAVGSQLTSVALAWQIYEMTNSPLQLGITGLFRAVPVIVFALTGGWLADRIDRRRLLIVTQIVAMVLSLLLAVLTDTGRIRVWHIYAVTFLSTAVMTFDQPARSAMIPSLVPREHLATAFALNITLRQTAMLAGPFIGGLIIAWAGLSWSYYIDAASFLGVIVCLLCMRVRQTERPAIREPALKSMHEGFAFVWKNSAILALLVMDTCVSFFGAYRAMMPVFARDILGVGPKGLGVLLGAPALGALIGSSAVMGWSGLSRKPRLIIPITLLYTFGLVLFGLSHWFALSFLIALVLGAVDSVGETLRMTIIQLLTPDQLRGRVQGLVHVFVIGGPFMGHGQIGLMASAFGAPGAVIAGGIIGSMVVGLMAKKITQAQL